MSESQEINATELNSTIEALREQRNSAQDQVVALAAKLAVANEQLQYISETYDFSEPEEEELEEEESE